MFVQSERFVEEHGGRIGDIAIYGQESQLHDLAAVQDEPRRARHRRRHRVEQRGQLPQGRTAGSEGRFRPGQSAVQHLRLGRRAAARGRALEVRRAARRQRQLRLGAAHPASSRARTASAGFVLANGSMSSSQNGEGEIRQAMVEGDVVDCMVALPGQLFYSTQIPVCLWFLARDRKSRPGCATGAAKCCSSTRANSARWWTGRARNSRTPTSLASRARIMPGAARRTPAYTKMCLVFARRQAWRNQVTRLRADAQPLCRCGGCRGRRRVVRRAVLGPEGKAGGAIPSSERP